MKLNNKGQALVEYVLIIALISVVAVSLVTLLGGYLKDSITKTSCEMMGEVYQNKYDKKGKRVAGEGYCKEINGINHEQ